MGIIREYFSISRPSLKKVPAECVSSRYRTLRNRTFWGATAAYSMYYVCRTAFSVMKKPIIDSGFMDAGDLGLIGSAFLLVYAFGKFVNGFVADHCNVRRFMLTGLLASTLLNFVLGVLGVWSTAFCIPASALPFVFAALWGVNGWAQSMGAPPGIITLSRWFPLNKRGTFYSIFSATPYLGKMLAMMGIGAVVSFAGWEWGFVCCALAGFLGVLAVAFFVSDTPESEGLPSIRELADEGPAESEDKSVTDLQKSVIKHPGIWVIALSSAFVYIVQYAISGWGILFLQEQKGMGDLAATNLIALAEAFGIAGTVLAGWLSDTVFKGSRSKPVAIFGVIAFLALAGFLFVPGSAVVDFACVAICSLSISVLYCIVAGLMALDIVPRKATGAALGIVGIVSYAAASVQDAVSGFLIEAWHTDAGYDFGPVSWFWLVSCVIASALPVMSWRHLKAVRQ